MSEPIKPALTAEEWAKGTPGVFGWDDASVFIDWRDPEPMEGPNVKRPHACAAALLYGQPFGFTREDVVKLRAAGDAARDVERFAKEKGAGWDDSLADWYHSIADRIEALLPPEGP